jgi:hypothetical protein
MISLVCEDQKGKQGWIFPLDRFIFSLMLRVQTEFFFRSDGKNGLHTDEFGAALRTKLDGCASASCHGGGLDSATTWTLDLSGSVEGGLSALNHFADGSPFFLVDDLDPDCSQMLAEVSTRPVGAVRMPVTGGFWSTDEVDCFRKFLHDMN